jgi:dienelactone hydrolase
MTAADVTSFETTLPNGKNLFGHAPATGGDLPVVVIVHGSHTHPKHYSRYATALAAEGFVVLAPEEEREVFGDTAHYPQQAFINWAYDWAVAENERVGSLLEGRVDTSKLFLTGHSMGGGVTLGVSGDFAQFGLVVDEWSRPPQLLAALAHGTHNIPPPRTGDPLPVDNQVPLAFIHGTADSVVTLDQSRRSFDVVHGVLPRMFVEVDGGNHFLLNDSSSPEGVNADKNPPTLDQDASIAAAARWTALWFQANAGDAEALATLRKGADEPHVRVDLVEA